MLRSRGFHAGGWEALEGRSLLSTAPGSLSPTVPVPKTDAYSVQRLESNLREAELGKAQIVVLGDSIADRWTTVGAVSWKSVMAPRGAVDFGIYGNSTGNLLSQIAAGELRGKPKVVVLMIGANNLIRHNSAAQVAQGISANVAAIRKASPTSQIVLMGLLPIVRASGELNADVTLVNAMISRLDDDPRIHFVDIYKDYVNWDGSRNTSMFVDAAHLSAQGYSTWARRISATLDVLTGRVVPRPPGKPPTTPPPSKPLTPPPAPPPTRWPLRREQPWRTAN
jgi:lysophospholipase L1-like esterase